MSRLADPPHYLNFRLSLPTNGLPRLFAMTDDRRGPDPVALIDRLSPAAGLVFRHYEHPQRADLAARVVAACRKRRLPCLVAGDIGLAAATGADGVHIPERMLAGSRRALNAYQGQGGRVTTSAHTAAAAVAACQAGVDGLFVSPVFATPSHPGAPCLGISRFARLIRPLTVPVFALGGVTFANSNRVLHAGAYGIAGIGLFDGV